MAGSGVPRFEVAGYKLAGGELAGRFGGQGAKCKTAGQLARAELLGGGPASALSLALGRLIPSAQAGGQDGAFASGSEYPTQALGAGPWD